VRPLGVVFALAVVGYYFRPSRFKSQGEELRWDPQVSWASLLLATHVDSDYRPQVFSLFSLLRPQSIQASVYQGYSTYSVYPALSLFGPQSIPSIQSIQLSVYQGYSTYSVYPALSLFRPQSIKAIQPIQSIQLSVYSL
jgi:hypothetical protein